MGLVNKNRIVRVRNKEVDSMLQNVATLTDMSYQQVFDVWLGMVAGGYLFGEETRRVLIEKVLIFKKKR